MIKATLSGTDCKVYDFKRDERGRLWCMVKCEYYNRPLPVYAGFIEVLDENVERKDNEINSGKNNHA